MNRCAGNFRILTMSAIGLFGLTGAMLAQPDFARAQASVDLTAVNALGLSASDQAGLDSALQAVANAIASGDQAAINAAQTQLASAITTAVTDNPDAAAQISGAATAAVPSAALTIAQSASAANPNAAAAIAVSVYTSLPPNLQDNANKTLIADAIQAGSGVIVTTALSTLNVVALANSILPPAPPPPPPPVSSK